MIDATELKNGVTFLYQEKPYQVVKYEHTKMGRGGATVRVTARNLETGSLEEKSFSSNISFDEISTTKTRLQFLYKDAKNAVFMDPSTYEQVEIPISVLGNQEDFLREQETVEVMFWEGRALSISLPPKVSLKVSQTDPGVKGNSATNIYKPSILENGMKLKVPLFINVGEKILVDTKTGEYVGRDKD